MKNLFQWLFIAGQEKSLMSAIVTFILLGLTLFNITGEMTVNELVVMLVGSLLSKYTTYKIPNSK